MATVLSLNRIRVNRRRHIVIDDFSLSLEKGDFVALIGANGSGKTTILRTILGFLRPDSGEITLFGHPAADFRRLRKRIGYVPQALPIDFRMPMTVRDVAAMGRYGLAGLGRRLSAEDYHIIANALRDTGIAHLAERPIGHLSGGELQKVQFARAVSQTPELLLLDEPTSNLDLGAQKECLDLINRLHKQHSLTTVIVMHDLKSLPDACNRAVIIDDSRKVYDGPFQEVFTESNLGHVYKRQSPTVLRGLIDELTTDGRKP